MIFPCRATEMATKCRRCGQSIGLIRVSASVVFLLTQFFFLFHHFPPLLINFRRFISVGWRMARAISIWSQHGVVFEHRTQACSTWAIIFGKLGVRRQWTCASTLCIVLAVIAADAEFNFTHVIAKIHTPYLTISLSLSLVRKSIFIAHERDFVLAMLRTLDVSWTNVRTVNRASGSVAQMHCTSIYMDKLLPSTHHGYFNLYRAHMYVCVRAYATTIAPYISLFSCWTLQFSLVFPRFWLSSEPFQQPLVRRHSSTGMRTRYRGANK